MYFIERNMLARLIQLIEIGLLFLFMFMVYVEPYMQLLITKWHATFGLAAIWCTYSFVTIYFTFVSDSLIRSILMANAVVNSKQCKKLFLLLLQILLA